MELAIGDSLMYSRGNLTFKQMADVCISVLRNIFKDDVNERVKHSND